MGFQRVCDPLEGVQRAEPFAYQGLRLLFSIAVAMRKQPLFAVRRIAQSLRSVTTDGDNFLGTWAVTEAPYSSNVNYYPFGKSFAFATSPHKGRQEWGSTTVIANEVKQSSRKK